MKIDIDVNKLKNNINNKLKNTGWERILSPYINSLSFDHIINKLHDNVEKGKRFTPKFKDIFNPFYECPYKNIKIVILSSDPYSKLGVADGLAFSCSNKNVQEKSLQYINEVLKTNHIDLRTWSNQGVLLLNASLTCEINKIGSHYFIWKNFTKYLFDNINKYNPNTIFILMGKKTEEWQILLSTAKIFKCPHPTSAIYNNDKWNSNDVFNKANLELKKQNKTLINW